ncbi:MAG: N-acetylmuramoyl-L-alanine amidase [Niabella sp.]
MTNKQIYLFVFLYTILFPCSFLSAQTTPGEKKPFTIIVDAGHGLPDVGARGMQTNEATITLAVSLKLAKALREQFPQFRVLQTRTTPSLPGGYTNAVAANRYRAEFANQSGGDLFIALHCNASGRRPGGWYEKRVVGSTPQTRYIKKGKKKVKQTYYVKQYEDVWVENKASGTETYIWAVGKNDQKVSSIQNNDDYHEEGSEGDDELTMPNPNDPAEKARMLIYAQHYFRKSYNLATLVEKEFIASGRNSRGVQQRNHKGIWVLQATGMPSILIEMGFVSNKDEEAYMMSEEGQAQIVNAIIKAIRAYTGNTPVNIAPPPTASNTTPAL